MEPIDRERNRLASGVYDQLVDALLQGTLNPGDRLVQDKLAEELDVSRSPVRDALQRLHAEGIIEPTGRRGFTVRHLSSSDVFHNYEGRLAVEGYAAGRLAELGAEALGAVWTVLDEQAAEPHDDAADAFQANRAIHRAIVAAIDNQLLLSWFDLSWGMAMSSRVYHDYYVAHPRERFVEEHRLLIAAIAEGDELFAREAMFAHIRDGLARTPVSGSGAPLTHDSVEDSV